MEFVIIALIGCLVFGICFAVLLLKGRKNKDQPARLHMCGHDDMCQCRQSKNKTD